MRNLKCQTMEEKELEKKFKDGMVVAIEPMINQGTHKIFQHSDGWTITTQDNKPSAHFEHNIAIIDGKPDRTDRNTSARVLNIFMKLLE